MLLVAVVSPIDYWADDYFFVHMIEHILIVFFAPILIVAGAPWLPLLHGLPGRPAPSAGARRAARAVVARPCVRWAGSSANPWTALVSFNLVMVLWHVPALFDAAEENQLVHIWLMHASFFVTGVLFWLQIIPSHPFRLKASPLWQIGAIISHQRRDVRAGHDAVALLRDSWYSVYAHVPGVTLSPFADQQIGAAILWVCGDFWAVPALVVVIRRAIDSKEGFSLGRRPAVPPGPRSPARGRCGRPSSGTPELSSPRSRSTDARYRHASTDLDSSADACVARYCRITERRMVDGADAEP